MLDYGDSHASFTVGTQSGTSVASWATHQQFSVLGSNGWLRCDFPFAHGRPTACHVFVGDHTSHGAFETSTYRFDPVNQYTLQVDRFSRYLRGEAVPSWSIEDSLLTLRIIEALFESARSGQWQALPPIPKRGVRHAQARLGLSSATAPFARAAARTRPAASGRRDRGGSAHASTA